ncbi:FAD-dependent oxidoreductase [Lentibacillus sp. N15]|uniref:FAD-dependent oxidoreductase n=1 Tax=Lentibacillus songyuanensis TaxID=3136161 RepID=UPI0031BA6913
MDGELVDNIPVSTEVKNGLVMKNQAQFHPTKYLANLVKTIKEKGAHIFENTTAVDIKSGKQPIVITRNGQEVTLTMFWRVHTSLSMKAPDFILPECMADRSYILAAPLELGFFVFKYLFEIFWFGNSIERNLFTGSICQFS